MSTILPTQTDRIGARLGELGIAMVDAPVGRSSKHAEEGKLLIMAGGRNEDVARARPLLDLVGDPVVHCGPLGAGPRTKVVNNYLSIALDVLTAEALTLAESSGIDRDTTIEVMKQTVAGMGHLSTTHPVQVLLGDLTPGFMIEHAHKDMGLALELGGMFNAPLFLGAAARQVLSIARAGRSGGLVAVLGDELASPTMGVVAVTRSAALWLGNKFAPLPFHNVGPMLLAGSRSLWRDQ